MKHKSNADETTSFIGKVNISNSVPSSLPFPVFKELLSTAQ